MGDILEAELQAVLPHSRFQIQPALKHATDSSQADEQGALERFQPTGFAAMHPPCCPRFNVRIARNSKTAQQLGSEEDATFRSSGAAQSWLARKAAPGRGSAVSSRGFSSSAASLHGGKGRPAPGTGIKVTFKNHKGEVIKEVEANEGDDIVDLSWEYDLDIEAACEKSVACSTCHC